MIAENLEYDLISGWFNGLMPDPVMTVSEWADTYRKLPETNAEPGQFKTSRTPYVREIIDKLSVTDKAQKIIWKKSSQVAATESGNNWLGYTIHIAPAAMLYIMPTDTQMKLTSKTRIQKMIDATPALRDKIKPSRSRDSGNTMMTKEFPGGFVNMTGANSPVGLSSLPVQKVYCDEADRYPADVGGEGDVISLAETRTSTFGDRRKMFISSTPTKKGESIIDKEFEKTGQRYYHVPCYHCGAYQDLKFEQLRWTKGDYGNTTYECEHCHQQIKERFKTQMLAKGVWIPKFPEREDGITFGYHINALASPYGWYSWGKMAQEYDEAVDDLPKYIAWVNTKKGECYETEGDSPAWESIYNKRENYKLNCPNEKVVFITAGVDIQKDRIEVEIVGWGKGKQSWSIDYRVLLGNTDSESNPVWDELGKIVDEFWTREDGAVLPLHLMAVDSGNNTSVVYAWCRKYPTSKVIPIKGGPPTMAIMVSPPKSVDTARSGKKIEGVKNWMVGVSIIKTELYGWLKLQHLDGQEYPNGYCHFPMYDETHFKSLTAEKVEYIKNKKGYSVLAWKKHYERNERLDCRVYARAAAYVLQIDRLTDEAWNKLWLDTQDMIPDNNVSTKQSKKKSSNFW